MDPSGRKRWITVALLAGISYFVVGFGFGTLAGWASSDPSGFGWRLAAWIVSAGIYGGHIWYEYFKLRNTPLFSSLHVASAVALGGFLLAIAAIVNSFATGSGNLRLLLLALLAFPLVTALPAFVVAFVGTILLRRFSRNA